VLRPVEAALCDALHELVGEEDGLQYGVQYTESTHYCKDDESPEEGSTHFHRPPKRRLLISVTYDSHKMTEVETEYHETEEERALELSRGGKTVTVTVTKAGYGMLIVADERGEVERYYGFDMALDHAAELLDVPTSEVEVPEEAEDMGM